jgi:hypothetical protein
MGRARLEALERSRSAPPLAAETNTASADDLLANTCTRICQESQEAEAWKDTKASAGQVEGSSTLQQGW